MDYFFVIKNRDSDIIKYDQYFTFIIWIVFVNISVNTIKIIRVINKSFKIIKML